MDAKTSASAGGEHGGAEPPKTKTSELSKDLDLTAPDRIDDALFNQILWAMLKPNQEMPRPEAKTELHLLQITR